MFHTGFFQKYIICKYSIKYKASIIATKFHDISSRSFSRVICKNYIDKASLLRISMILEERLS